MPQAPPEPERVPRRRGRTDELVAPRGDTPPHVHATAAEIARIAAAHNSSKEAIALAWLLRHPAPIQPILGTLKPERISPSVLADEVELSRIEWYQLLAAARGAGVGRLDDPGRRERGV